MIFDYRENTERMAEITANFDNLSIKQQLKFLDFVKQEENKKDFQFDNLILPILQDFAELTASVLIIEKNEENQDVTVIFKNKFGFDVTRNCKIMCGVLAIADYIGISLENEEVVFSLVFNCEKV